MDDSKEAVKQRRRQYDQKWRDEHREQVRKYARDYYQDHYSISAQGTKDRRRVYRTPTPKPTMDGMKVCPKCTEEKPIKGWHTSKTRLDGLNAWCNDCAKRYIRERHSQLRKNNPAHMLWESSRNRARGSANCRKIEFKLKVSDIIVPSVCPILGIPLYFACEKAGAKANRYNDHTPSVDRIDSSRGYTPDNIVVISWRANRIKCDATVEELGKIHDYFRHLNTRGGR